MDLVRTGLYVGNICHSRDSELLSTSGVTHILSLVPPDTAAGSMAASSASLVTQGTTPPLRKYVPLIDSEDEDLLSRLPDCLEFIRQGRKAGVVLVHCQAGISRSVAVVVAHLMQEEQLTVEAALASVQERHPIASPNVGFLYQLGVFHAMGCRIDPSNVDYRRLRLEHLGRGHVQGEVIEASRLAQDPMDVESSRGISSPEEPHATPSVQKEPGTATSAAVSLAAREVSLYRCRKCRRALVAAGNVLSHAQGAGQASFKWHKRGGGTKGDSQGTGGSSEPRCSSIFVEPMRWMSAVVEGETSGKIVCAKCSARLGTFNWAGEQCSCGAWVTPSFQLHKSRIDASWT